MDLDTPLRPACMTDSEWDGWLAANGVISKAARTPCRDCLVPFYRQMLGEGRCDGYPGRTSGLPYTDQRRIWRAAKVRHRERAAEAVA